MLHFIRQSPVANARPATHGAKFVLWIDGVGCFWLYLHDRVSIGRPESPFPESRRPLAVASDHPPADIAILSDLKRQHAIITRGSEGYWLEARDAARVAGHSVLDRCALADHTLVELGRGVALRFRQPSPLSLSARLDFVSDHRPTQAVDGIVLMADTCLLGPGEQTHIECSDWPGQIVLVRKGHDILCRSPLPLTVNEQPLRSDRALCSGDLVAAEGLRFRIE